MKTFSLAYLKSKYQTITVANSYLNRSYELFQDTINYMKQGIPIIYQGVVHNYDNQTYGSPDLLIRSDYINDIFGYNVIDSTEEHIKSPLLNTDYIYIVIDILFIAVVWFIAKFFLHYHAYFISNFLIYFVWLSIIFSLFISGVI